MGKLLGVYLSTEEMQEMEKLCEQFSLTPYRVLRLAFQVLCKECEKRMELEPDSEKHIADRKPKKTKKELDLLEWLAGDDREEGEEESENNNGEITIEEE